MLEANGRFAEAAWAHAHACRLAPDEPMYPRIAARCVGRWMRETYNSTVPEELRIPCKSVHQQFDLYLDPQRLLQPAEVPLALNILARYYAIQGKDEPANALYVASWRLHRQNLFASNQRKVEAGNNGSRSNGRATTTDAAYPRPGRKPFGEGAQDMIRKKEAPSVVETLDIDNEAEYLLLEECSRHERYMDPFIGAYISEDPVRQQKEDHKKHSESGEHQEAHQHPEKRQQGDPNLYRYVENNPINKLDPSGHSAEDDQNAANQAKKQKEEQDAATKTKAKGNQSPQTNKAGALASTPEESGTNNASHVNIWARIRPDQPDPTKHSVPPPNSLTPTAGQPVPAAGAAAAGNPPVNFAGLAAVASAKVAPESSLDRALDAVAPVVPMMAVGRTLNAVGSKLDQWGNEVSGLGGGSKWAVTGGTALNTLGGISHAVGGIVDLPDSAVAVTKASTEVGQRASQATGSKIVGGAAGTLYGIGEVTGLSSLAEGIVGKDFRTDEDLHGSDRASRTLAGIGGTLLTGTAISAIAKGLAGADAGNAAPVRETPAAPAAKGPVTSVDDVAAHLRDKGALPDNFITKDQAKALGWDPQKGNLQDVAPGKSIGGDPFGNREGSLPSAPGRTWQEADTNYKGGFRGSDRILYSNDGLIYKTTDHYKTFTPVTNP